MEEIPVLSHKIGTVPRIIFRNDISTAFEDNMGIWEIWNIEYCKFCASRKALI